METSSSEDRQPWVVRALVVLLIVVPLVAFGWVSLVRSSNDNAGSTEIVVAGQTPTSTTLPGPALPDIEQDDIEQDAETPESEPELPDAEQDAETGEPIDSDPDNTGDDPAPASTQPTTPQPDLGLDNLVRELMSTAWGGETPDAFYESSTDAKLESGDADVRRRGEFELEVSVQLGGVVFNSAHYGQLFKSLTDNWDTCLIDNGLPPVAEFVQLTETQQEALYEDLGLVGDRMEQLEVKCWSRARIYAGKDAETDRLLGLLYEELLDVAERWVEANPGKVVPLAE